MDGADHLEPIPCPCEARLRASVQLDFGRVLHPDEVAADKTLALFGRAAARDLVDVAALTDHYPLQQLCALPKRRTLAPTHARWPTR